MTLRHRHGHFVSSYLLYIYLGTTLTVADLGGGGPPPYPLKTSNKKDDRRAGPQVSEVIGPPSDKFLDPLLTKIYYTTTKSYFRHGKNVKYCQ